jgi:pilus assembly protein CpaD
MPKAPAPRHVRVLATALLVALPLAGCGTTDRIVASSVPLDDYHARHPIVLAEARTSIDLFPSMGARRLDSHTAKQVFAFAQQYRDTGQGEVLVLVPRGRSVQGSRAVVADIEHVLKLGGATSGVIVSSYPVADPRLASPIRLSYRGLKATVADQCGQWPSDLNSASSIQGWENKPYWNLGCSTQTMIAAQTSDPRDLVAPRGEEPADTLIRSHGIETVRKGTDPNTAWAVKNSNIGAIGSN